MIDATNEFEYYVNEKLNEMKKIKPIKKAISMISKPKYEAPLYKRTPIDLSKTELVKYQTTKLISPLAEKNHSMRSDMFISQMSNMTTPIDPEIPMVMSALEGDILSRSTYIEKLRGDIELIHVFSYTTRKIYLFRHNGVLDILDTTGIITTNGVSSILKTDLCNLEMGETYDISSDNDNFILSAPDQYDEFKDIVKYGINVTTIYTTDGNTADDACFLSQELADKLAIVKTKSINIDLNNRVIKSEYPNIFPNLREEIKNPIICKIVEIDDRDDTADFFQSTNTPVGHEDEQIMCMPNSFINYIEVIANEPIKDPILENYRQGYLAFRREFVDYLNNNHLIEKEKWSVNLQVYHSDFSIDKFRIKASALNSPRIKLELCTISHIEQGSKVSSRSGAKATAQGVFPTGMLKDELGRNIDMLFSVSTHIARLITGALYEQYLTSCNAFITHLVKNNITEFRGHKFTENDLIKAFRFVLDTYKVSHIHKNLTDAEIVHIMNKSNGCVPISIVPYESFVNMETAATAFKYLRDKFGYEELEIGIYDENDNKIGRLSSKHTVGSVYMFRDVHDSEYGNSSMSVATKTTKGIIEEKSRTKHDGTSLYVKKATKVDVQQNAHHYGLIKDEDLIFSHVDQKAPLYIVKEMLLGMGIAVNWEVGDE